MDTFVQLMASGLALGATYALVALGFVVIYRASQVFNFAHGELLTIGAFTMVELSTLGLPWPVALVGAMTVTGAVGAGVERTVLRPRVGRPLPAVRLPRHGAPVRPAGLQPLGLAADVTALARL